MAEKKPAAGPPQAAGTEPASLIRGTVQGAGLSGASCLIEGRLEPVAIVIFGASGDLTSRKLIPALYHLFSTDILPPNFLILGAARSQMSHEDFRRKMRRAVEGHGGLDLSAWDQFAAGLFYHTLEYDSVSSYQSLQAALKALEEERGTGGNRLFNLALPPSLYGTAAGNIAAAGLARPSQSLKPWSRLVVEKPFGRDLASAMELNQAVHQGFKENQVFRIDHYLAKETVQNLLVLRFANAIFEPLWNRNYIEQVAIIAAESIGVEHRAGYYEQAGVLRDMFQNHMMQLLALVAMEPPSRYGADRVRDEKNKVFRSLRPVAMEMVKSELTLGQYQPGQVAGAQVPGYRQEPGVDPGSLTPTFGLLRVFIDNWRWQGVPFFLASGKRLASKVTRLAIHFRQVPHSLFREVLGEDILANRLVMEVQPDETINITFQTKTPGARLCLNTVKMVYDYNQEYRGPELDAYEKALLDCMLGDQLLFWRQDGVEQCWAFLEPVLKECESCRDRQGRLHPYAAGSWGPEAARDILPTWPEPAL